MWRWVVVAMVGVACEGADRADDILSLSANEANGEELYRTFCASCHAVDGSGGTGANIQGASARLTVESMLAPPALMPDYSSTLTDQEMADIAAYVESL